MRLVTGDGQNEPFSEHVEFLKHMAIGIAPLVKECLKAVASQKRLPIIEIINFCVTQGYLNGCIDMLNSEEDKDPDSYVSKLRRLFFPVRIELEGRLRKLEGKDPPPKGSGA